VRRLYRVSYRGDKPVVVEIAVVKRKKRSKVDRN